MIRVVNTIRVKKGRAEEVLGRFQTPKSVHTFEGFVLMEVLHGTEQDEYDELKVCTTWADQASFENWLHSRDSKQAHGKKSGQKTEDSPILGNEVRTFDVAVQHQPATV